MYTCEFLSGCLINHQVSLTMSSNPPKKGFQAIVLDSNNDMMGDFNAGSGTSISSQGSKKYANHTHL